MICNKIRSALFDFQDGILSAENRKAIEDHLTACPSCRAVLAEESKIAEIYRAGFAEWTRAHPFSADDIRLPTREKRSDRGDSPTKTKRLFQVLAPVSMGVVLVLASLFLWRPFRHEKDIHGRPAPAVTDELPDPFRDWIEGRMIVTIEDKAAGSLERIETNRHGIVARSTETRGNR
jgi:anti-sigma factor RsiW